MRKSSLFEIFSLIILVAYFTCFANLASKMFDSEKVLVYIRVKDFNLEIKKVF